MYSSGPLHRDEQRQDVKLEYTSSSSLQILDAVRKTCQKQWTIGRGSERGSEISVLIARHDDDDDIYIYIYIDTRHILVKSICGWSFHWEFWNFDLECSISLPNRSVQILHSCSCKIWKYESNNVHYIDRWIKIQLYLEQKQIRIIKKSIIRFLKTFSDLGHPAKLFFLLFLSLFLRFLSFLFLLCLNYLYFLIRSGRTSAERINSTLSLDSRAPGTPGRYRAQLLPVGQSVLELWEQITERFTLGYRRLVSDPHHCPYITPLRH